MIVDGIRQRLAQRLHELGQRPNSKPMKARLRQHQLSEAFVAQLLKGRADALPLNPGISKLERLAKALDVSHCWLILGIRDRDAIHD